MFKNKTKWAMGLMVLVNVIMLLWVVFGYGIFWEVDDDPSMAAILAGAYGDFSHPDEPQRIWPATG